MNPTQVSNMFMQMQPDPRAERQNMLSDLQAMESLRGIQSQNQLGQILASGADYDTAATQYLQAGGDPKTALQLRQMALAEEDRAFQGEQRDWQREDRGYQRTDRERKNVLGDIEMAGAYEEVLSGVTTVTPQTWGAWRKRLEKVAKAADMDTSEVPTEYDEAWIAEGREALKNRSRPTVENIDGRTALYSPKKDDWTLETPSTRATYGVLSAEQAKAMGLPDGGTYRISSDGKVEPITRPPSETQPAKVQLMEYFIAQGIETDPAKAWKKANEAVQNPTVAAGQMARAEFDAQKAAMVSPGDPNYRPLQDFYNEWLGVIEQGAPTAVPPAPPVNERVSGTMYQTPKGPLRWVGDGWSDE